MTDGGVNPLVSFHLGTTPESADKKKKEDKTSKTTAAAATVARPGSRLATDK